MEQLPLELKVEILSRLPPRSLVQFKSLSKQWNSLLKEKSFVEYHFSRSRPQFMFRTKTNVYLIDILNLDPNTIGSKLELRDQPSYEFPLTYRTYQPIFDTCDGFLFCKYWKENMIEFWNPWLRQVQRLEYDHLVKLFCPLGIGYNNSKPEKAYKVFGKFFNSRDSKAAIFDCASQVFKFIDLPDNVWPRTTEQSTVSLNGNLYWVSANFNTWKCFIQSFDFSMDTFKPFCLLPRHMYDNLSDELVLVAFKADRLSLLSQSSRGEIKIWVTEKMITREEKDVVWINLMTLPTTILPRFHNDMSYFIYDKTLFMCCVHLNTFCIYIVREDLCKKIDLFSWTVDCHNCVFTPSFISVPCFRD